ncbi:MAG: SDR family oxidoreductase [Oscillospiraceae bacterium]|nr:SDR family oxidoreductase [Oscillospiraceae bacterium]
MGILSNKIAIMTGASSGVGYGCALRFAMEGAKVVACARRTELLEKLREEAEASKFSGEIIPQKCDVGVEADMDTTVKKCVEMFGTVHILANIAQSLSGLVSLEKTTVEIVQELFDTGPIASMLMMQKCFPYMKEQHYGRIINTGSPAMIEGGVNLAGYNMAKSAILGLTRTASQEWGQYGITTNIYLPTVWTENFDKTERGREYARRMTEENPMRFFGRPYEDCAPMLAFLASEAAGYVNGQVIGLDGGTTLIA